MSKVERQFGDGYLGIIDKSRTLMIWVTTLFRVFRIDLREAITEDDIFRGCGPRKMLEVEVAAIGDGLQSRTARAVEGDAPEMSGVLSVSGWAKASNIFRFIPSDVIRSGLVAPVKWIWKLWSTACVVLSTSSFQYSNAYIWLCRFLCINRSTQKGKKRKCTLHSQSLSERGQRATSFPSTAQELCRPERWEDFVSARLSGI